MPEIETHLPGTPSAVPLARGFLRAALHTWALDGFGELTELLTSELVSNAVRHVGAPLSLRVAQTNDRLRVEVADPSPTPPVRRHPDRHDVSGRGLALVDALADDWGSEPHRDHGKTVWFELDVSTAEHEIHDASPPQ